jgi:hypothetical protein
MLFNKPVLLLAYNRPAPTRLVFERIRAAQPPRLYFACDAPKTNDADDANRVAQIRRIVQEVDWPCEVKTLFQKNNLGCRLGPEAGINWFFEHETEGIILEDDCLPHPSFFNYCQWALDTFRDHKNIWHINGNNFNAPKKIFQGQSIAFATISQVWGWASWADRWQHYQGNPFYLQAAVEQYQKNWRISKLAKLNKFNHLLKLQRGLDAWDYQWQLAILNAGGLVLNSRVNLITNVGNGEDATHTRVDKRVHLPVEPFAVPASIPPHKLNVGLTSWYEKHMGLRSWAGARRYLLFKTHGEALNLAKNFLARLLFGNFKPVVVASTGRAGSTMLWNCLADGMVKKIYSGSNPTIKTWLRHKARGYIANLKGIRTVRRPVLKTHGLYNPEFGDHAKYVFIYGNAMDAALSVKRMVDLEGHVWFDEHQYNLESSGDYHDLFELDVLNYEKQISTWTSAKQDNILVLHYEDLWDQEDRIAKFVGFDITLPPRRARSTKTPTSKIKNGIFEKLERIEQSTANRLNNKLG